MEAFPRHLRQRGGRNTRCSRPRTSTAAEATRKEFLDGEATSAISVRTAG